MKSDSYRITPLRLVLIIVVGIMLWMAAHGDRDENSAPSSAAHSLYIASPGLSGDFDGLTIFFDEQSIVNNRIKVILDGELYWIRLEKGVYP